jgi:putative phosphotransacetylase
MNKIKVPIEVSSRHCHLSKKDLDILFGEDYELNSIKKLSQKFDFACEESVSIEFGGKKINNVRVVAPPRDETQVEISLTDAYGSEIQPDIKLSGDLSESTSVKIIGPNGEVRLDKGLIIAKRHLHCSNDQAKEYELNDGDVVSVETIGDRSVIFNNVSVRVKDDYDLSMHIDTDEGNAAGIKKVSEGFIL